MKVYFKILIFFFFISCGIYAQNIHSNDVRIASDVGLKGNIKFVKKRSYYAKTESGKIVKSNVYRGTHFSDDFTYEFNAKGKVIRWTQMDSDKKTEEHLVRTYTYDSLDRIIKLYMNSRLLFIYDYDSLSGKLAARTFVGAYGNLDPPTSKDLFTYNKKGQLIKETHIDHDSKTEKYTRFLLYKYDVKGRIIHESQSFTNSSSISKTKQYTYNNKTTLIIERSQEIKEPDMYQKLDSTGKLIEFIETAKGSKEYYSKDIYSYDVNDNVISKKEYLQEKLNAVTKYEYEYDAKGNWTKMIVFVNDVPDCIHEREITYY